jgi:DNA polymerase-3 subunit epsilon
MLKNITLERPLAILDLETTGINLQTDRIVEISVLKLRPNGPQTHWTRRFHPGMPIPPEATAIHGITDGDVAGEPRFADVADEWLALLDGCDLCGFNMKRFDLKILSAEFSRAGRILSMEGRAVIDPMEIFHRREPRDLAAAVSFYLDRGHQNGHSAAADVLATASILDAMVLKYPDLPRDLLGLHRQFSDLDCVDSDGFFRRVEGQVRFVKGKHRGQRLEAVAAESPSYLEWMLGQSFPEDTKAVVREALAARRPRARHSNCVSA